MVATQECKKMLLDVMLTLWCPNLHVPTQAGGMLPQDVDILYALKSFLGHSEINKDHKHGLCVCVCVCL